MAHAEESESAVDRALAAARLRIAPRAQAADLDAAIAAGTLVVDTRPAALRSRDGEIPGAVVIERNVLEWRLDPSSPHRLEGYDGSQPVILVCDEGYASSLAAAALRDLGVPDVTDLEGGYQAWRRLKREEAAETD